MKLQSTMLFSLTLLTLFVLVISDDLCVYTIYVKTGSIKDAGTNANITVSFYDNNGGYVDINELSSWGGLMGPGYNYYEEGNLDVFSNRGSCLKGPMSNLQVYSYNNGEYPAWYLEYIEIAFVAPGQTTSIQLHLKINQWLSLTEYPYSLSAVVNI